MKTIMPVIYIVNFIFRVCSIFVYSVLLPQTEVIHFDVVKNTSGSWYLRVSTYNGCSHYTLDIPKVVHIKHILHT